MRRLCLYLTGLILLATSLPAYGQPLVYCPTAPEERSRRCARVSAQIAQDQEQIASTEALLRDPEIILARVESGPEETLADYRARVERQQGVATPQSNTWLLVRGHYYNPTEQRMYVALARASYWHYIWEGLAFDPELAEADFKRREGDSRREKAFQLENPDSAMNRMRYALETLLAFQRECCAPLDTEAAAFPADTDILPTPPTGSAPSSDQRDLNWP